MKSIFLKKTYLRKRNVAKALISLGKPSTATQICKYIKTHDDPKFCKRQVYHCLKNDNLIKPSEDGLTTDAFVLITPIADLVAALFDICYEYECLRFDMEDIHRNEIINRVSDVKERKRKEI